MIKVSRDDTVAAALLRAGILQFRYATAQEPRGPFCMMGTCFDCLVEIDGKPNRQACQTIVRNGMVVRRQRAPNAATPDKRPKP
jgi:predicted molibdopterin-dependent oxidoreductase YjgC